MSETKAPEEWAQHERHQGKPRCRYCQQPLLLPESVERGYCHRPGCEQTACER